LPTNSYFCDSAGEIKVGATRRFLFFGSSSDTLGPNVSDISDSRFFGISLVEAGVTGGVAKGGIDPVDDIEAFLFDP